MVVSKAVGIIRPEASLVPATEEFQCGGGEGGAGGRLGNQDLVVTPPFVSSDEFVVLKSGA